MAISDVLFEAAAEIERYLNEMPGVYDGRLRRRIERLKQEMDRIRLLPGMDSPPKGKRKRKTTA